MDSLRARGVNRFALLVYGGGAVLLAPWIVVLHENQATQSFGYHLKLTSLGMSLFIVVGMVVTAVTCRRATSTTLVAATSTATFLFIAAWFNTITAKNGPLAVAIVYDVLIKIPMIALSLWLAARMVRDKGTHERIPRWIPAVYLTALVVLIPWFVTVLTLIQRSNELHNLRLFWTGLDIFELYWMAFTALWIFRGSPRVALTATVTGNLLFSDAWFNIVTTEGLEHRAAVAMAFVEIPIAIYSIVIAKREVATWSLGLIHSL